QPVPEPEKLIDHYADAQERQHYDDRGRHISILTRQRLARRTSSEAAPPAASEDIVNRALRLAWEYGGFTTPLSVRQPRAVA
ncbi:hypothetical protein, partial [Mycobacterium sp.]|uniref:hypothetical protein n=1 Tax=Mycobacterium sp. TaxID=1785 RepID=UPI003C756DBB